MANLDKYYSFIETRRLVEHPDPTHKHHIIPKFMKGRDVVDNLIELSYEDHLEAHLILANSFEEGSWEYIGNMCAVQHLKNWVEGSCTVANLSGINNPMYGRPSKFKGVPRSAEAKLNISKALKGRTFSKEWKHKLKNSAAKRDNSNIGKYDKSGDKNPSAKSVVEVATGQLYTTMMAASSSRGVSIDVLRRMIRHGEYKLVEN